MMDRVLTLSLTVPLVSDLFSDTLIALIRSVICAPIGMTTRPEVSSTSVPIVAVISSPTLFLLERISASVVAVKLVPAARAAEAEADGDGAGAGVGAVAEAVGFGAGVGAGFGAGLGAGFAAGLAAGAGAGVAGAGAGVMAAVSAPGRSLSVAVVSTGASCRSRFRLSADATSRRSPRPAR